ncbi:MAG: tRNA dihydrouridine synthase [Thermoplasmatota archaeon]
MTSDRTILKIRRKGINIGIEPPLIAAPMAGAIDHPYRTILHEYGCPMSFTEMISSRGLYEESSRTRELVGSVQPSGYTGAQIFGSDPEYLGPGSMKLEEMGFHLIDLNSGCPKRKVMSQGSGGALLKDADKLLRCLTSLIDSVSVPVGIKMRSAYRNFDEPGFRKMLLDIEGSGASYVTIHPRTVVQGFSGSADRNVIPIASDALSIPVIASGDVRDTGDVSDYLNRGASGVMIGRALLGDPTWFMRNGFQMESTAVGNGDPRIRENIRIAGEHLHLIIRHYGEERGVVKFRSHLGWYLKGFAGKREFRDRIYKINSKGDAAGLLEEISSILDRRSTL